MASASWLTRREVQLQDAEHALRLPRATASASGERERAVPCDSTSSAQLWLQRETAGSWSAPVDALLWTRARGRTARALCGLWWLEVGRCVRVLEFGRSQGVQSAGMSCGESCSRGDSRFQDSQFCESRVNTPSEAQGSAGASSIHTHPRRHVLHSCPCCTCLRCARPAAAPLTRPVVSRPDRLSLAASRPRPVPTRVRLSPTRSLPWPVQRFQDEPRAAGSAERRTRADPTASHFLRAAPTPSRALAARARRRPGAGALHQGAQGVQALGRRALPVPRCHAAHSGALTPNPHLHLRHLSYPFPTISCFLPRSLHSSTYDRSTRDRPTTSEPSRPSRPRSRPPRPSRSTRLPSPRSSTRTTRESIHYRLGWRKDLREPRGEVGAGDLGSGRLRTCSGGPYEASTSRARTGASCTAQGPFTALIAVPSRLRGSTS